MKIEVDLHSTYQEFAILMIFFSLQTSPQANRCSCGGGAARHPRGRRPHTSPRLLRDALASACTHSMLAREKSATCTAKKEALSLGKPFLLH
ncbi:hypothetical protein LJR039_005482 [Pseudorhodoferax sp. LjRoot39]|uniref:hypothetical protein n=1 Tax=Pseudorhodoferax sp. LjRoot39 TaxID=3342328 RepID=UPI003ECFDFD1